MKKQENYKDIYKALKTTPIFPCLKRSHPMLL